MSDKDKLDSQGLLASLNSSSSSPLPLVKPKLPVPFSVRAAILVDEDLRAAPVEVRADEPTVVVRAAPGEPRRRELSGDSEWGGVGRRRTATSNYASMRVASTTSQLHLMCVCVCLHRVPLPRRGRGLFCGFSHSQPHPPPHQPRLSSRKPSSSPVFSKSAM